MNFTIDGQVPSKKNSKQLFMRGGKPHMVSSQLYQDWETDALWQLKAVTPVLRYPVEIEMVIFMRDKRRRDLDNCISSVLDALVKAGVLLDDDWQHVASVKARFGAINKYQPRCLVSITVGLDNFSDFTILGEVAV